MAQKYTILKVLIRNSSKVHNSNKGFTLIELIFGLLIMVLVGGLAMNALIEASNTFSKDKKHIDSSQNLSAILEMIGNDVRQSGEQISSNNFPALEVSQNTVTGTIVEADGSSTITIRRALTESLTLCADVAANATPTELIVADDAQKATAPNCNPLPLQTDTSTPALTIPLRKARNYRCKLDDLNGVYTSTSTDFCLATKPTVDLEQVRAAIFDNNGNFRVFNYKNDNVVTAGLKFKILINSLATQTTASAIGSPIYLIEERTYRLDNDGTLKLSIDGGAFETLIKGIASFKVAAKLYSDTTTKALNTAPANGCTGDTTYTCTFTRGVGYNWKNVAGIKVDLRSRYDASGRSATPTAADLQKLTVAAEFFPRNVLSK
jgi:type II secretory pathway pseudopilin PulG